MSKLTGKVALVTGSGRGIGRAIALKLASEGARVVVNDLDEVPAMETLALIERAGGVARTCIGSVAAADFGPRLINTALDACGDVHTLVNNAGYTWDNVIQKMSDEQFDAMIDVHLKVGFCGPRPSRFGCSQSARRTRVGRSRARLSTSLRLRGPEATQVRRTMRSPRRASSA